MAVKLLPQHTKRQTASSWPRITLVSRGPEVWLSLNFGNQVSHFSHSGVLIVLMCRDFCRVIFFSNVCLSSCSLSSHYHFKSEISLICLSFSTKHRFPHQSAVKWIFEVWLIKNISCCLISSNNVFIFTVSFRAWRLHWETFREAQSPRYISVQTAFIYSGSVISANWSWQITADN